MDEFTIDLDLSVWLRPDPVTNEYRLYVGLGLPDGSDGAGVEASSLEIAWPMLLPAVSQLVTNEVLMAITEDEEDEEVRVEHDEADSHDDTDLEDTDLFSSLRSCCDH